MNAHPPLHRRRFVAAVLSGIGLALVRSIVPPGIGTELAASTRLAGRLAHLFTHGASARHVGRAYLRQATGEQDVATLARRIEATLAMDARTLDRLDDASLRGLIERRVRQDFADERTRLVDGWMLSETEARLSAVAALTEPA